MLETLIWLCAGIFAVSGLWILVLYDKIKDNRAEIKRLEEARIRDKRIAQKQVRTVWGQREGQVLEYVVIADIEISNFGCMTTVNERIYERTFQICNPAKDEQEAKMCAQDWRIRKQQEDIKRIEENCKKSDKKKV